MFGVRCWGTDDQVFSSIFIAGYCYPLIVLYEVHDLRSLPIVFQPFLIDNRSIVYSAGILRAIFFSSREVLNAIICHACLICRFVCDLLLHANGGNRCPILQFSFCHCFYNIHCSGLLAETVNIVFFIQFHRDRLSVEISQFRYAATARHFFIAT